MALKVGIITTSVREGKNGDAVAKWVLNYAKSRKDADVTYEVLDIAAYKLPFFGVTPTEKEAAAVENFKKKIAEFDAYIFVVAEYNHAITGAFKNATDFLNPELNNKVAGYVGYGGLGAARAIEGLRIIQAEQQLATVQKTVNFLLAVDFENYAVFKPAVGYHEANADVLFTQLLSWASVLKTTR